MRQIIKIKQVKYTLNISKNYYQEFVLHCHPHYTSTLQQIWLKNISLSTTTNDNGTDKFFNTMMSAVYNIFQDNANVLIKTIYLTRFFLKSCHACDVLGDGIFRETGIREWKRKQNVKYTHLQFYYHDLKKNTGRFGQFLCVKAVWNTLLSKQNRNQLILNQRYYRCMKLST